MQDVAVDFLRRVRSIIEAAGRGLVTEDDLSDGRNSMNELLEQDWVMPRAVSDVSIHWRLIEDFLRTILEGKGRHTDVDRRVASRLDRLPRH